MAYEQQTWVDGVTPLDAEHLNHVEEGISQLSEEIANISQTGISAAGATSGQVPVADGNGGWAWGTVSGENLPSAEEVSF